MSYSNIFERPPIMIHKDFIQLIQRIQSFNDVPKHCMLAIQVIDIFGKCDEDLASTTTFVVFQCGCNSLDTVPL